jgi:hypothetical protein
MKVEVKSKALGTSIKIERQIGYYSRGAKGPTIIFIGGIHGNEPSGVFALDSVLNELNKSNPPFRGEIYGFAGNLTALSRGVRYVNKDLNRIWKSDTISKLESGENNEEAQCAEEKEQWELYEVLKKAYRKKCPVYAFDLHTTSSESQPFITIGDTIRNRVFAMKFPIPIILGIEEQIDGTLLNYISELGFITMGFESGQHDALTSIQIHTALIWLVLYNGKCMESKHVPNLLDHYHTLAKNVHDNQKIFEVRYRYDISMLKKFAMKPGFQNFQKIGKGDNIAQSENGMILSREKGLIFLPLYQNQGDDGFFVVREIMPFWLRVSFLMRKNPKEKILPYLPGIQKHPQTDNTLIVNTKIARWYVLEFFHLLGYRRETKENGKLVVAKRKWDIAKP